MISAQSPPDKDNPCQQALLSPNTTTRSARRTPDCFVTPRAFLRRLALIGLLAVTLALSGCAYHEALDRGDAWANAEQWEEALKEYRRANRLNPDGAEAVEGIGRAKRALSERSLDGARRSLSARDYVGAFTKINEARKLTPDLPAVEEASEAVTTMLLAEARDLLSGQAHSEGMALLDLLLFYRPEMSRPLEDTIAQASQDWAARLRAEASEAEAKGQLAVAFVLMAHAGVVSGEDADRQAQARLKSKVLDGQAFHVYLELSGDAERLGDINRRFNGHLARSRRYLRVVRRAEAPGAILKARVSNPSCAQTARAEVASHRYVSGTRQSPNPRHASLQDDLMRCERDLLRAEERVDDRFRDLQRAEDALARAESNRKPDDDLSSERREVSRRRDALLSARRDARREREDLLRARERLNDEPAFREEDVISEFLYEIRVHTRRCEIVWEGTVSNARNADTETFREVQSAATSDRSHAAQVRFGIAEDTLRFPRSDDAMTQAADEAIAEALSLKALTRLSAHRQALITQADALAATDPAEATRLYVIAFLLEPDDGRSGPGLWLRERYQLTDIFALTQ